METNINDHIFEVRYKPNPKMLDYRGVWTAELLDILKLTEWKIGADRIDVNDKDMKHHAFISFSSAGYITRNVLTQKYFPDNAIKFTKLMFNLPDYEKKIITYRVGVRCRFCTPYEGTFDKLVNIYSTRIAGLTESAKKALNAGIKDIGSPITLTDEIGTINFMGGPMDTGQIIQFFGIPDIDKNDIPKVGLVFDFDYWITPNKEMDDREISNFIQRAASAAQLKNVNLCELIFRD